MKKRILFIGLIITGFVLVRVLGGKLFYDPLIAFFHHSDYSKLELPELDVFKYLVSLLFRFLINFSLTLALVKVLFNSKPLLKLTSIIFLFVFVLLTPVLIYLILNAEPENYRFLFYIRRILMHPVITLILIPAFLYNERTENPKIE